MILVIHHMALISGHSIGNARFLAGWGDSALLMQRCFQELSCSIISENAVDLRLVIEIKGVLHVIKSIQDNSSLNIVIFLLSQVVFRLMPISLSGLAAFLWCSTKSDRIHALLKPEHHNTWNDASFRQVLWVSTGTPAALERWQDFHTLRYSEESKQRRFKLYGPATMPLKTDLATSSLSPQTHTS